jgi:hypothetical protein
VRLDECGTVRAEYEFTKYVPGFLGGARYVY